MHTRVGCVSKSGGVAGVGLTVFHIPDRSPGREGDEDGLDLLHLAKQTCKFATRLLHFANWSYRPIAVTRDSRKQTVKILNSPICVAYRGY